MMIRGSLDFVTNESCLVLHARISISVKSLIWALNQTNCSYST